MNKNIKPIEEIYKIRGKKISVTSDALIDENTNKIIFNEKLDNIAIEKAFQKYRMENNIFGAQRIKELRKKYNNISQRDFAALLGWSPTTLATYETGALPSTSNNLILLQLEKNPLRIKYYFDETSYLLSKNGRDKIYNFIDQNSRPDLIVASENYGDALFKKKASINTGFNEFDLNKFGNLLSYISSKVKDLANTKLNKMLFYIDFKFFKEEALSVTGLQYAKLPYGPVPDNYASLYPLIVNLGYIKVNYDECVNGIQTGVYNPEMEFDKSLFSIEEIEIINLIIDKFKDTSASELSKMSHEEEGWKKVSTSNIISYDYADELNI